ncbi:MAG: M23 family metallopeptidase [Actinomycetota bacterium]
MPRIATLALGACIGLLGHFVTPAVAVALEPGSWLWPVSGPVVRAFDPPDSPFGAGHRGVDVAVAVGSPLVAPAPGTVKFAGRIGGHLFLSIAHGESWESTASWLSTVTVRKGDTVFAGQPVGTTGSGHPGAAAPHVHLGVKHGGAYVDPLLVFAPLSLSGLIRLAPLGWATDPSLSQKARPSERHAADAVTHAARPHRRPNAGAHGRTAHPARADRERRDRSAAVRVAPVPTRRGAHRVR